MGRRTLFSIAAVAATIGIFVVVGLHSGHKALAAAVAPDWGLASLSLLVAASVQPFRALAWATTLRAPVGFRALYCSSSVGSLLDTVLPGRLGEASKAAVLRVAAGDRWPGFPRAAGSLLCSHMLEPAPSPWSAPRALHSCRSRTGPASGWPRAACSR